MGARPAPTGGRDPRPSANHRSHSACSAQGAASDVSCSVWPINQVDHDRNSLHTFTPGHAEGDEAEEPATLGHNVDKGLPCGSKFLLARLEALAGRSLRFRSIGRPRRPEVGEDSEKG